MAQAWTAGTCRTKPIEAPAERAVEGDRPRCARGVHISAVVGAQSATSAATENRIKQAQVRQRAERVSVRPPEKIPRKSIRSSQEVRPRPFQSSPGTARRGSRQEGSVFDDSSMSKMTGGYIGPIFWLRPEVRTSVCQGCLNYCNVADLTVT